MTVGNSHGGLCFTLQDGRRWRPVASADLTVFYRAVAHTVCQRPAGWSLLLQPANDGRMAELVGRPEPAFRVWRRSNLLVDLRPHTIVEMVRRLELSLTGR